MNAKDAFQQHEQVETSHPAEIVVAAPILPGKVEAWRRFCQELLGARRRQYEESRRRLGITKEDVWLLRTARADVAVVHIESEHPEQVVPKLATSEHPFDRWLKRRVLELHGLDLTRTTSRPVMESVFEWGTEEE